MPTINKIERKPKPSERKDTDMRELRRKAYNNTQWRKMRDTYMHEHPICEECLKKGIGDTTFTKTEVHGDCLSNWTLVSIVKETSSVRITECHFTFNGETTVDRDTVYFTAKKMSQAICLRPLS